MSTVPEVIALRHMGVRVGGALVHHEPRGGHRAAPARPRRGRGDGATRARATSSTLLAGWIARAGERSVTSRPTPRPTGTRSSRRRGAARARAYAPYSRYRGGRGHPDARSARVYAGCNVENATYGATLCAERAAIAAMVAAGDREPVACVVVTGGPRAGHAVRHLPAGARRVRRRHAHRPRRGQRRGRASHGEPRVVAKKSSASLRSCLTPSASAGPRARVKTHRRCCG